MLLALFHRFAHVVRAQNGMDEVVPSTVLPHVYTYLVKYGYKKTARQLKKEAEVSCFNCCGARAAA